MGLPFLFEYKQRKVESANKVYEAMALIMRECHKRSIPFTIENPSNSYFWCFPAIEHAMDDIRTHDVNLQACMYASARNKWTRLVTNDPTFRTLAKACNGTHKHKPWGQVWHKGEWHWATKLECEYTQELCEPIATKATETLKGKILPTPNQRRPADRQEKTRD